MEMQLKTLRERHTKAESKRKKDMAVKMKKDDLRRRLLAGSVVIDRVQRGKLAKAEFKKWLDAAVTESSDRALFGL